MRGCLASTHPAFACTGGLAPRRPDYRSATLQTFRAEAERMFELIASTFCLAAKLVVAFARPLQLDTSQLQTVHQGIEGRPRVRDDDAIPPLVKEFLKNGALVRD